jgi:hypothetical protein
MATTSPSTDRHVHTARTLAQRFAAAVGAMFLLVGILGFIPGITTNYSDMSFAGHDSGAQLLGLFQVSVLHNLVHLLFGVIGLAAAKSWSASRSFLLVGGLVYLALWLYGLVIDKTSDANFIPVDTADNWLHFGLGVGMIGLGLIAARARYGTEDDTNAYAGGGRSVRGTRSGF